MSIDQIIEKYLYSREEPRVLGRYWASEIFSIAKGYITPQTFFNPPVIPKSAFGIILSGLAYEAQLNAILSECKAKFEYNPKKEIKINDEITLVVKPDFVFPNFIWETKYPSSRIEKIPTKWEYQLEAEYRAFQLPVYLVVFEYPFKMHFYPFTPSEKRWKDIQKILVDFHLKLKGYLASQ